MKDPIRDGLVRALEALREGLRDDTATDLRPEDVVLDAAHLVHQHGIGVDVVFVDLRAPAEVAVTGTLPGARRLDGSALLRGWKELPDDVLVLVDHDGRTTPALALRLRQLGHAHAWSLDGGFAAWRRAGGEIEPA